MVRIPWFGRQAAVDTAPSHAPADEAADGDAARLLAAFRADPTAADLRPVVKAMTRDVTSWTVGHPAAVTAQDAIALREAMLATPELVPLMAARLRGLWTALAEARADDVVLPPMSIPVAVASLLTGEYDDMLRLLAPGSSVRVDIEGLRRAPHLASEIAEHVHRLGMRISVTGLRADGSEDDLVELLRPDVIELDRMSPLDYRDRLEHVLRLRAVAGPTRPDVVMCGVSSSVDAWAAVTCGATHLAGPLYDNEEWEDLTAHGHARLQAFRTAEVDAGSAFEMAAAHHGSSDDTLDALLDRAAVIRAQVCALADQADVYVVTTARSGPPERVVSAIQAMVDAGAAVTVVGSGLTGPPARGVTWGCLSPTDPFAKGWAYVVLTPGHGYVLTGLPVGDRGDLLERRYAFVEVDDRELALRIASRVSSSLGAGPTPAV